MKGVKLSDLQSILQFIYLGQTEVSQEHLATFMAIAAELEINGLVEENIKKTQDIKVLSVKEEPLLDMFEFELSSDQEDSVLKAEVTSVEQNPNKYRMSSDGKYQCDECEYKTNHKKHMETHRLSVHVKMRYECNECTKEFSDPSSLRRHKKSKHEGVRFACDQCSRSSTTAFHLSTHKRIKHSTESTVNNIGNE